MNKKSRLIIFLFFFIGVGLYADNIHNNSIDSLQKEIIKAPNDTTKINLYLSIIKHYQQSPDSIYKYAQKALDLSEEIKWKKGIAKSSMSLTSYYYVVKDMAIALQMCHKVLENEQDDDIIAHAYSLMSSIYSANEDYDRAMLYARSIIDKTRQTKVTESIGFASIGDVYRGMNKKDSASLYLQKALKVLDKTSTEQEVSLKLTILSQYSFLCTSSEERYTTMLEAKKVYEEHGMQNLNLYSTILSRYASACLVLATNEDVRKIPSKRNFLLREAEASIQKAIEISKSTNFRMLHISSLSNLHKIYYEKGEYKKAYACIKEFYEEENSFFSQENKNKLAEVETKRQAEKYENEISLKQLELENKHKQLILYIAIILFLLIIVGLMVYFDFNRRKTHRKLARLNEELTEANELKNKLFGILNHDLRKPVARLISFLKFKSELPNAMSEDEKIQIEKETLMMTENLLQSMEELLIWCKNQMDYFMPELQNVRISVLFDDIKLLPKGNSNIEIHIPEDIIITTDINYMKTIIRNLSTNAIQATQHCPDPLVVWEVEQRTNTVCFIITDNGTGMSEDQKEILKNGANTANISKGLGLHIIHDLAKNINCEIDINESVTVTEIRLTIPLLR